LGGRNPYKRGKREDGGRKRETLGLRFSQFLFTLSLFRPPSSVLLLLLRRILPLRSQITEVILGCPWMAGCAAGEVDITGNFDFGVENFEEFGFANSVGETFALDRLSRKCFQIVPH
jgi:hypothetical protein